MVKKKRKKKKESAADKRERKSESPRPRKPPETSVKKTKSKQQNATIAKPHPPTRINSKPALDQGTSAIPIKSGKAIGEISRLQHELNNLTLQNAKIKRDIEDQKKVASGVEAKLRLQRRLLRRFSDADKVLVVGVKPKTVRVQERIKIVENSNKQLQSKVDLAKKEINEKRRENSEAKAQADRLNSELKARQMHLDTVLTESGKAHAEKEIAVSALETVTLKIGSEKQRFQESFKRTKAAIKNDHRVELMLSPVAKVRQKHAVNARRRREKAEEEDNHDSLGERTTRDVIEKALLGTGGAWSWESSSFEEAYEYLRHALHCNNLEGLCDRIVEYDQQNKLDQVSLKAEKRDIEGLEHSCADMRVEIAKYNHMGMASDEKNETILQELEKKLASLKQRESSKREIVNKHAELAEEITAEVQQVFNILGCHELESATLFNGRNPEERQCMQYLGSIEQRISDMIQVFVLSNAGSLGHGQTIGYCKGPLAPSGLTLDASAIGALAPHTSDLDDQDEMGYEVPLLGNNLRHVF